MPLPAIERKALFKAQVTRDRTTLDAAAKDHCGVTWYHLADGLEGNRSLSIDVKEKFAAYIGRSVADVFGDPAEHAA